MTGYVKPNQPWLYDSATNDIVGIKNADGSETLLANAAQVQIAAGYPVQASGDTSGATDYAAILAAANNVSAAGGGVVVLAPSTFYLGGNTIPLINGVIYQGSGQTFNQAATSGLPVGGTRLVGNGTAPAFAANTIVGGAAPTVYATFFSTAIRGCGARNMVLDTFSYGVQCGNLWTMGCQFSEFSNLDAINCGWGFWFENFIECQFENLNAFNYSQGAMWFYGSGGSALNNGNSTLNKLYAQAGANTLITTMHIRIGARGTGTTAAINDLTVSNLQANGPNQSSTQAATMTASSANITVVDGTKFAVDMPVAFSATTNGFLVNTIYYVTSVVGNVITVSGTVGGSNATANAANAVNIITQGFESIAVVGYGSNFIQPCSMIGLDAEAAGTTNITLQNTQGGFYQISYVTPMSGGHARSLTMRNCSYSSILSPYPLGIDIDLGSTSQFFGGRTEFLPPNTFGNRGLGIGVATHNQSGQVALQNSGMLNLRGQYQPDLFINAGTNGLQINNALHLTQQTAANAANLAANTGGQADNVSSYVYSTASAGSWTLPAITTTNVGLVIMGVNPQASALTVNTSSSQNIVGLGASGTSISIAANSNFMLQACNNGGTLFWARYA